MWGTMSISASEEIWACLGSGKLNTTFRVIFVDQILRCEMNLKLGGKRNMKTLHKCPKCSSRLELKGENIQVCSVCKYWTEAGTARLDSITILE
ncbi:hypothetical protein SAMN04488587_0348 [Methanococcoides vulcani]|uniref:Uncharacterized protein n=1 Tax=Methanococcoides vulcani TaxID=1353158 RepID=A0A1H9Y8N1_9EURY|nr:hypothetical protein SAMN04488587_0348 [Methanococcoides vulcani]